MRDDSYSAKIARESGSNFYWSFFFLPKAKKQAIFAIYAFCRLADDAVDEASNEQQAHREVKLWRQRLQACYNGGSSEHPLLPELSQVVRQFQIPQKYFEDLLIGVEMDLIKKRYPNFQELETYCYHVASTIGLLCNHLFGYPEEAAYQYAIFLGKAFQLTNIIRDVGKDASLGRIYLPQEDLERFGVLEKDILELRRTPGFEQLIAFESRRAEDLFQKAFNSLPKEKRSKILPAEMMAAFYHRILIKIRKENFPVLEKKVSLSNFEKVRLLLKPIYRSVLSIGN